MSSAGSESVNQNRSGDPASEEVKTYKPHKLQVYTVPQLSGLSPNLDTSVTKTPEYFGCVSTGVRCSLCWSYQKRKSHRKCLQVALLLTSDSHYCCISYVDETGSDLKFIAQYFKVISYSKHSCI